MFKQVKLIKICLTLWKPLGNIFELRNFCRTERRSQFWYISVTIIEQQRDNRYHSHSNKVEKLLRVSLSLTFLSLPKVKVVGQEWSHGTLSLVIDGHSVFHYFSPSSFLSLLHRVLPNEPDAWVTISRYFMTKNVALQIASFKVIARLKWAG